MPKGIRIKRPGKPTYQDVKDLKTARALIDESTAKDAYQVIHPAAKETTARAHAQRMITPDVFEYVKQLLSLNKPMPVTREDFEKMYLLVISRYMAGVETGNNYLNAVNSLVKLKMTAGLEAGIPKTKKEIEDELKAYGIVFEVPKDNGTTTAP